MELSYQSNDWPFMAHIQILFSIVNSIGERYNHSLQHCITIYNDTIHCYRDGDSTIFNYNTTVGYTTLHGKTYLY